MRQADINRINKAKEHLKAAIALLRNIKWENRNYHEDEFIHDSVQHIESAGMSLDDVLSIQER